MWPFIHGIPLGSLNKIQSNWSSRWASYSWHLNMYIYLFKEFWLLRIVLRRETFCLVKFFFNKMWSLKYINICYIYLCIYERRALLYRFGFYNCCSENRHFQKIYVDIFFLVQIFNFEDTLQRWARFDVY